MTPHVTIPVNEKGRDFVVGDIHGHYDLLMEELSYEGFDAAQDRVFSVGDLIDRGPNSLACLKLLDCPWFYAVRGNHEQMMMNWALGRSRANWQRAFGMWTEDMDKAEIAVCVESLMDLPISMTIMGETYSVGICHAEPAGFNWTEMISDEGCFHQMMWGRKVLTGNVDPRPVEGVDITVHGHTPLPEMRRIGNRFFLDTGAGQGKRLTVQKIGFLVQQYRDFAALA